MADPLSDDKTSADIPVKKQEGSRATQWKKGQSGNPKGRTPNDASFTVYAKEFLAANIEERNAIVQRTVTDAKNGDSNARKLLWSYIDGLPPQTIDMNLTNLSEDEINRRIAIATKALSEEEADGSLGGEGEEEQEATHPTV